MENRLNDIMLRASCSSLIDEGRQQDAIRLVLELACEGLHVARAGAWFLCAQGDSIRCELLLDQKAGAESADIVLHAVDYPRYFAALQRERFIAAHDACNDPVTSEFKDGYLQPLGVTSMLDVPIRHHGRMIGIICCEHIGPPRQWTSDEVAFAAGLGDMVGRAINARASRDARAALEQQIQAMNQHAIISIADPAGTITFVNEKFVHISGYAREELLGANHRIVKSNHHAPEMFADIWHTISAGKIWSGELCNRSKNGALYWVSTTIVPFLDDAGTPYQYVAMRTDITHQKNAELTLQSLVHDLGERVKEWMCLNAVIQCLLNDALDDNAVLQAVVQELPAGWQCPEDTVARIRYQGKSYASPGFVATAWRQYVPIPRGEPGDVIEICRLQEDPDPPVFLPEEQRLLTGLAGQISHAIERRQARRDALSARDAAEAANRAKSRFLATMSHEIRTPMNGVLGMAQMLLMPGISETDRTEFARTILHSGQSLLSLLNDILDLSKVEAGKVDLERKPGDPQALVQEVGALFSSAAKDKGLTLVAQWQGAPGRYHLDLHRLHQMLSNYVGNALKFTQQGEVRLIGREIDGEADSAGATLEFSVSDTGIGISPAQQALLFQPFSQADTSTTRQYGGTGLGLSIVSMLAELMGGTAGCESTPGQGSRFWFRIRAQACTPSGQATEHRAAARMSGGVAATASAPAPAAKAGQVLVVEDNLTNQLVIRVMLGQLGVGVTLAANGQEALAALQGAHDFVAVFMDLQMPVMDGFEATAAIRRREAETGSARLPIIALTANAFEEDRQRCQDVGMDDYLAKPVDYAALKVVLHTWRVFAPA